MTTIDCGLPVPLLTIVTVALRAPAAAGMKVMLKLQPPPAATVVQFDPLTANSPLLLLVMEETETDAPPMLLTVTACGALDVPTVVAGMVTFEIIDSCPTGGGAVVTPAPDNAIGKLLPPPVNVYVALSVITAVGEYVNTIVQLAPAPSVALPQVPDLLNFAGAAG